MNEKPPIPSPFPEAETCSFRASFTPVFAFIYGLGAVGGLVGGLIAVDFASRIADILVSLFVGAIAAGIYVVIVINTFKVNVSQEYISSYNAWCLPARLRWEEITSARRANVLGLKYLKLSSATKKNVLWVPLFLADISGFKAAISKFAGIENPLRQQLN